MNTPDLRFLRDTQSPDAAMIFTPSARAFVADLARTFAPRREEILAARIIAQRKIDDGALPDFAPETRAIREGDWQVAPPPPDLQDRRVEITAPADRKKTILALNSPAKAFMADFEDSLAPTWANFVEAQAAMFEAARGECRTTDLATGKRYEQNPDHECVLIVRPRGWHLREKNILQDGDPIAAAFADFGFFIFHCAAALRARGRGAYLYLPKTEHWREAALWEDVVSFAEERLGIERGATKATLLIETLPAAFQMHEILHALRGRAVGLNCGRWDYIFSYIKTLRAKPDRVLPERQAVTMTTPFLRAYSRLLIQTCHRRGAHAMGGMAAFIPIKNDEAANAAAIAKVRADKEREAEDGHDGTWVAHPGLIAEAKAVFDAKMPGANQKDKMPDDSIAAADLLAPAEGEITAAGFANNIQVALRYIASWLAGAGAAPIFHLMEDAATAEIARAQLWQWIRRGARLADGREIDEAFFRAAVADNFAQIESEFESSKTPIAAHLSAARDLLLDLATAAKFPDFLTLPAYERLEG